jgi:hypothetical protein
MNVLCQMSAGFRVMVASRGGRRLAVVLTTCFLLASTIMPLLAEGADEPSTSSQNSPRPIQVGSITVSGEVRGRAQSWNWFLENDRIHYTFGQSLLRLAIAQKRSKYGWKIAVEQPALYSLPSDALQSGTGYPLGLGGTYYAANGRRRNTAGVFVNQIRICRRRRKAANFGGIGLDSAAPCGAAADWQLGLDRHNAQF